MLNHDEAREIVLQVRKEIEESKGTRIWGDYINALKLISQVVFTRSSGFILEFVQNAEDSGLGLNNKGVFEIYLNKQRTKIVHNGKLFEEQNVKSICGISSTKKPETGTLGYLGIGFKSVFKVTDSPEIYSGNFQFKFDRNYKDWVDPNNTPWHVIPIWIENLSEPIDNNKTTFIIPNNREENSYQRLLEEASKLNTQLYLFLRWLKKIEITDEGSGRKWVIENLEGSGAENPEDVKEGIVTLKQDSKSQRFKIFRRTLTYIPPDVKNDRLTQEYRANVAKREITVAFALDDNNNLSPIQAGAMYGGVYSFLPLGEAKSGVNFPIQADFLVQPGRDAINYEAKWNHWLLNEIMQLCKEAIDTFKQHPKWKYQILPTFEFRHDKGLESYDRLFGPRLIEPLENYISSTGTMPIMGGGLAPLSEVVKLNESEAAIKDFLALGILKEEEIAPVLGGDPKLKLADPAIQDSASVKIRQVDRLDLLNNKDFLQQKSKESNAADWFRKLYLWLQNNPRRYTTGRRGNVYNETYSQYEIIFTSKNALQLGGKVSLIDLQSDDPILNNVAKSLEGTKEILNPSILIGLSDDSKKAVRGFLLGNAGVQLVDSKTICKELLLPVILTSSTKPSQDVLITITTYCKNFLANELPGDIEFWVLTKDGAVKSAKETLLPSEFNPEQNWESYQKYVPGISFVSPTYLNNANAIADKIAWRDFFYKGAVGKAPISGVEVFAENYAKEKLETRYLNVTQVDKLKMGYDFKANDKNGQEICIEVKGQGHDQEIELTANELGAADKYTTSFYIFVVTLIPDNPSSYLINNPSAPGIGKKDKLTIPIDIWKAYKW